MPCLLWLAFERPGHPDAVCHPATADDVLFVLELLASPGDFRQSLAAQLSRYLGQQADIAPWSRPAIPCRRESGLYCLVPWRLAKWLSRALIATPTAIERTQARLNRWLAGSGVRAVNVVQ